MSPLVNLVPSFLAHHEHAQAEIHFIVEGEGVKTIEGEEKRVSKGDAEHGIRSVGRRRRPEVVAILLRC